MNANQYHANPWFVSSGAIEACRFWCINPMKQLPCGIGSK
jgi:hypothetical protein